MYLYVPVPFAPFSKIACTATCGASELDENNPKHNETKDQLGKHL